MQPLDWGGANIHDNDAGAVVVEYAIKISIIITLCIVMVLAFVTNFRDRALCYSIVAISNAEGVSNIASDAHFESADGKAGRCYKYTGESDEHGQPIRDIVF